MKLNAAMLTDDEDLPGGSVLRLDDFLAEYIDLLGSLSPVGVDSQLATELGLNIDFYREILLG